MEYMDILWKKGEHANQQLTNCAVDKCSQPLSQSYADTEWMFRHINGSLGTIVEWVTVMVAFDYVATAAACWFLHHSHSAQFLLPKLSSLTETCSGLLISLPVHVCVLFIFFFLSQTTITCVLRVLCTFDL